MLRGSAWNSGRRSTSSGSRCTGVLQPNRHRRPLISLARRAESVPQEIGQRLDRVVVDLLGLLPDRLSVRVELPSVVIVFPFERPVGVLAVQEDRKSTPLNSSHSQISY